MVIPTNTRMSVFTMRHIDNWDSKSQRNFSQSEYHGCAKPSVTRQTWSKTYSNRDKRFIKSHPWLPDSYMIQVPVELAQVDVLVPNIRDNLLTPTHDATGAQVKEETPNFHRQRGRCHYSTIILTLVTCLSALIN